MINRFHEIEKARRYVNSCEDEVTNAMHCGDEVFRSATARLRQAQIRLSKLEEVEKIRHD